MPRSRYRSATCLLAVIGIASALTGCNDATSSEYRPGRLAVTGDVPPIGLIGAPFLDTLRVRLEDPDGSPRKGKPLTWTVQLGGGSIAPLADTTDANGIAAAIWTLGPQVGLNRVEVRSADDSTATWEATGDVFRVDRLDSNYGLACAIRSGDLWCWGGSGWKTDPVSYSPPNVGNYAYPAPGLVAAGLGYSDVAVGSLVMCALTPAGSVHCYDHFQPAAPPQTIAVPALRSIATGGGYGFCGLAVADSTAWCWDLARDSVGQLPGSPAFIDLSLEGSLQPNQYRICGLLADSTAACAGTAPLGDSTSNASATPVPVHGGHRFLEVTVGRGFTCGRTAAQEAWCWGENADGVLGYVGPASTIPVLVTNGITRIRAARQTVAAIRFGAVVRWGDFGYDDLAHPPTPLASMAGLPVVGFADSDNSCMYLLNGQVYCFEELWVDRTAADIDVYFPVHPVGAASP